LNVRATRVSVEFLEFCVDFDQKSA
jgi:hypothetical protein